MDSNQVFTHIYKNNVWGVGTSLSPLSGDGSNPDNAKPYVSFVENLIKDANIKSVLDFGHGDWEMWRDYKFDNCSYIGIDVADSISEQLNSRLGSENRIFTKVSPNIQELPAADLFICKEVLQHLSNSETLGILNHAIDFDHIVICNAFFEKRRMLIQFRQMVQFRTRLKKVFLNKSPFYRSSFNRNNADITTGDFRGIDLTKVPFSNTFREFRLVTTISYLTRKKSAFVTKIYYFQKLKK